VTKLSEFGRWKKKETKIAQSTIEQKGANLMGLLQNQYTENRKSRAIDYYYWYHKEKSQSYKTSTVGYIAAFVKLSQSFIQVSLEHQSVAN